MNRFRKLKWNRVRKEMREHIKDIVERALDCGNIEKGYIKHKCLECKEEYIHGFTCKTKFCSKCGRLYSLKLNPHIHALFTEGGIDKNNKWFKSVSHIPYKYLRRSWQKLVLDIIKKNFLDIRTKRLVNKLYKTYNEGFYVNAERDLTNIKQATKYIGKLTQHIHPKGFRVIRRYGLYARSKNKLSIEIIKLYNFIKQRNIYEIINKSNARKMSFKERLIETFGVNPFRCSNCGSDMILWKVWHHKYGIIYDVLDKSNYRISIDDDIGKEVIKKI